MKNRLEALRKSHGVSQEELAAALEVSRQTIGSLEHGRYNPSIILAFKLARYFYLRGGCNMKERNYDVVKTVVGILLAAIGFVLLRRYADSQGVMAVLPFVRIGVGCGAFGHGMGGMLSRKALKGSPDLQKQLEIEQKDERNIAISNSAKGKAFDIMLFVYGALMLSFALMQVDLAAILLFVFCYLLVLGCSIYYRVKYEKEM